MSKGDNSPIESYHPMKIISAHHYRRIMNTPGIIAFSLGMFFLLWQNQDSFGQVPTREIRLSDNQHIHGQPLTESPLQFTESPVQYSDMPVQYSSLIIQDPEVEAPVADALGAPSEFPPFPPGGDEPIGQAPENNNLQFLRQTTVLLSPGEWQFDIGIEYSLSESDFTDVLPGSILAETNLRTRTLMIPLEARVGLTRRTQLYAALPVGWIGTEISRVGNDRFINHAGIGDFQGGITTLVRESCCVCDPDIIATFGFTAPTGNESFLNSLLGPVDNNLGQGFWAASWNVTFIHTYDPVVLFYGVGSRHRIERTFAGRVVKPGAEYFYRLGVGFAVNESITLSTEFLGSYVAEPHLDGVRIAGLIREPMRMRFAVTIADDCRCSIIEPFAEIGMTDDAASGRVGITWTY